MRFLAAFLSEKGKASLVLPAEQQKEWVQEAAFFRLYPARICTVFPKKGSPARRVLIEWRREKGSLKEEAIIIQGENGYTEAYQQLTSGFYLKH